MKLTSVELHPENSSEIVVLSFRDPRGLNPYNVKGITGLDADEIVPKAYGGSGGSQFYNLSLLKREIVVIMGLNPNFAERKSYSDLRDALYRCISSSRSGKIQLRFKNEIEVVAAISGFVSKFETGLFEKTQEVQLTITCDEPMLKALEPTTLSELTVPLFSIHDSKSTAPHGFSFAMTLTGEVETLSISDPEDDSWSFVLQPPDPLEVGDTLFFSSEYNDKFIFIIRDDETIHLADTIVFGSVWPIIFPGENSFTFGTEGDLEWIGLSYFPCYWGV